MISVNCLHSIDMDINAEVSAQLSLIDVLLHDFDSKSVAPCTSRKHDKHQEETQDAMPDSTTNTEKTSVNPFHCGDDVLVPNKDGRYYLGTIVELSTSNDNDSCEVGAGEARCLVKFGDGTHAWAPVATLKLLSAPPPGDGRIMCVVCKQREGPTPTVATNAIIACDMCGRGYHAKCHSPPVDAWINGASWHCKRCVEQRYKVAAAENRAIKRSDLFRYNHHQLSPPCDTASTTSSTASEAGKEQSESNCYCGQKSDYLAQMLLCCRCDRWFHQRCVSSLQYPLYAGDKLYIFACATCNGGEEYLRRLELCWLELAHLALYNLTVYNSKNYFDLDTVIMPYIMDNWHALQLPEKMWRTGSSERRERVLTALTSSRKRFKCGREMKKRATIWGLRLRRPPPPHHQLARLHQLKKEEPLTDARVRALAPRLRFLPRAPPPPHHDQHHDDSSHPSSSNGEQSSNRAPNQRMIVPVDGHWLNLMMGKRFHENLNSNSNSENDSTSSFESLKPMETDDRPALDTTLHTKADDLDKITKVTKLTDTPNETNNSYEKPVPSLVPCTVKLDKISKDVDSTDKTENSINITTHNSRIATMNLEVSKLSTKNIIEHSKIMSLQHMDRIPTFNQFSHEIESSGDETSSRGTLDAIIPPLKDFQGKNNPFLMQNTYTTKNKSHKVNGKQNLFKSRLSLPMQLNVLNPLMGPLVRPLKRKLCEKDIIIGPNGEVKRRKYRRPRKYLQLQINNLNKSCPVPEESSKASPSAAPCAPPAPHKLPARRLRQRQEKNYYENARRNNTINNIPNNVNTNSASASLNSVKSLQLSPHKSNNEESTELSKLKSSVLSYFRAGRTFSVLARRLEENRPASYLIEWDSGNS